MSLDLRRPALITTGMLLMFGIGGFFQANARPAFAKKEKKKCVYCHLNPGGGERGFRGIYYRLHDHTFKGFNERSEAAKAGVKPEAIGQASKPTKQYPERN